MPLTLLPASAQAFAPRSAPNIVLNTKIEPWLTQTLKRVNRTKRPLNNITQHTRCLLDILSGPAAIWSLASLMVPKSPDASLLRDSNPLTEALANYHFIHVEAYVVHVDTVSQNDVAFKLTSDSITALIKYHKEIYSVDVAAAIHEWSEKEQQLKKLHEDFVQAVNKYVFRTDVKALEGLEEEGAGELLEGRSGEVKNGILALFLPLLPPPKPVDVVPMAFMAGSPYASQWWQPVQMSTMPPGGMQSWRVLSSSQTYSDTLSSNWLQPSGYDAYGQPAYIYSHADPHYTSPPASAAQRTAIPLPSVIAQQCSATATSGYATFAWAHTNGLQSTLIPT